MTGKTALGYVLHGNYTKFEGERRGTVFSGSSLYRMFRGIDVSGGSLLGAVELVQTKETHRKFSETFLTFTFMLNGHLVSFSSPCICHSKSPPEPWF